MNFTDVNDGNAHCNIELNNVYPVVQNGKLDVSIIDRESGAVLSKLSKKMSIKQNKPVRLTVPYDKKKVCVLTTQYTDSKTGKTITKRLPLKYILTPAAPATPRFNAAPLFGVRPGSPVIYRFPVSGERPMKFTCADLPAGLSLKEADGVLSGKIDFLLKEHKNLTGREVQPDTDYSEIIEQAKEEAAKGQPEEEHEVMPDIINDPDDLEILSNDDVISGDEPEQSGPTSSVQSETAPEQSESQEALDTADSNTPTPTENADTNKNEEDGHTEMDILPEP